MIQQSLPDRRCGTWITPDGRPGRRRIPVQTDLRMMREMVEVEVSPLFQIGDKVVHPMHGAGIVESIVQKKVNGVMRDYYVLKLPVRAMVVMIPTENSEEIGVRPIVDREQADRVLEEIGSLQVEMTQNWNRRYRENMERLKSGDLFQVACVVKGLMLRDVDRGLSTGERKMLHSAKQILISEIVMCQSSSYEAVEERINRALA